MDEQQFQLLIERNKVLQATALAEKNTQMNTSFDFIQMQRLEEEQYYGELAHKPGEMVQLVSRSRGETLAPRLEERGLSEKRKEKLRKRTVSSYEKGKKTVGEYATAQTIPLMRSIKKNKAAIDKQSEKERKDIVALANMVLPVDIFDTNLTEKHTHFDVKNALKIKDALDRISEFKANCGCEYELLDYEVIVRLENLLAHKTAFDSTLRIVLAANGLSMDGEPLKDEEMIKKSREEFEPTLAAYKEVTGYFLGNVEKIRTAEGKKVRTAIGTLGSFQRKSQEIRDAMLLKDSPKIVVDGVERDAWSKWQEIKGADGFLRSDFYNRSCYRMKEDKNGQSFDDYNYEMILMDYNAWRLSQSEWKGTEDRSAVFEEYKKQLLPYYKEYIKRSSELCDRIRGKDYWTMLSNYEEMIKIELQGQHLADMVQVSKIYGNPETSIQMNLGLSDEERRAMGNAQEYLSAVRKVIDQVEAIKALNAGMELRKDDLSASIQKKNANLLDERGVYKADELKDWLIRNTSNSLINFKVIDERAIARYDNSEEISQRLKERQDTEDERKTDVVNFSLYVGEVGGYAGVLRDKRKAMRKTRQVDLGELKRAYDSSALAAAFVGEGTAQEIKHMEVLKNLAFFDMLRELLQTGTLGFKDFEGQMVEADTSCFSVKEITDLLRDFSESRVMKFAEPLLKFDADSYLLKFRKSKLKDPKTRLELVAQTLADCQKILDLKQFMQRVVKPAGVLSEDSLKQLERAAEYFDAFSQTLVNIGNKSEDESTPTEIIRWVLPDVEKKTERALHEREIVAVGVEAEADRMNLDFKPNYVLSIEEMRAKFKSLSLIDENGRRRITLESSADELVRYGKTDLVYYKGLSLYADAVLSAGEQGIRKTLKKDAEDMILNCKRVKALYTQLQRLFSSPKTDMIDMVAGYEKETEEYYEQLMLSREKQSGEYHKGKVAGLRKESGAFDRAGKMIKPVD